MNVGVHLVSECALMFVYVNGCALMNVFLGGCVVED